MHSTTQKCKCKCEEKLNFFFFIIVCSESHRLSEITFKTHLLKLEMVKKEMKEKCVTLFCVCLILNQERAVAILNEQ